MTFDPSQNAPGPEVELVLRPRVSRAAILLLTLMTLLALISLILSGLPGPLKVVLALLALGMAAHTLYQHERKRPTSIVLHDQSLTLWIAADRVLSIKICKGVFLSPWYLGFVGFDERGLRATRLALFRDQLDREAFRQLSAWFRRRQE